MQKLLDLSLAISILIAFAGIANQLSPNPNWLGATAVFAGAFCFIVTAAASLLR